MVHSDRDLGDPCCEARVQHGDRGLSEELARSNESAVGVYCAGDEVRTRSLLCEANIWRYQYIMAMERDDVGYPVESGDVS